MKRVGDTEINQLSVFPHHCQSKCLAANKRSLTPRWFGRYMYNNYLIHEEDHEYHRKVAQNLQGLQFVIITIVVVMNMCSVHQIHQRAVTDARKNFRRQGGRGLLGAEVLLLLLPLAQVVTYKKYKWQ